ncbi:MAG: methyl-accepting chemotaxis protein [Eubacteriales bacterium]
MASINARSLKINKEAMEAYKLVAPFLSALTFNELSTGITDSEKFIAYYKGTYLDLGIKVGDPIKPGSPVDVAIKQKKRVLKHVPKEVIGIPYVITANPVFDERGYVIGAIATGTATEKEAIIKDTSAELSAAINQITSAINDLAKETEKFSSINSELIQLSGQTQEQVSNTADILEYIKDIASETKVLGINASIEAARAGNYGLGFKVVASEIQKLATNSLNSVKSIEETLKNVNDSVDVFVSKIQEFSRFSHSQIAMTEETTATIDELKKMSLKMLDSVKDII